MNYQRINQTLENLKQDAPRRAEVLQRVLSGQTDEEIARDMKIHEGTVRKQISIIYENFGLNDVLPGESRQKRSELAELFAKHKPELAQPINQTLRINPPRGIIPLDSPLYVEREVDEYLRHILSSHTDKSPLFIQIQGAKGIGKSSLLIRLHHFLEVEQKQIVGRIDLGIKGFTSDILGNQKNLLYQFTYAVAQKIKKALGKPEIPDLRNYWRDDIADSFNCTNYLHEHVFSRISQPKTLLIDNIDAVLDHEQTQQHFLDLFMSWYEQKMKLVSQEEIVWPHIVIVYSAEAAGKISKLKPLQNLGIILELPEFTEGQIIELANKYGLDWGKKLAQRIKKTQITNGHPGRINKIIKKILEYRENTNLYLSSHKESQDLIANVNKKNEELPIIDASLLHIFKEEKEDKPEEIIEGELIEESSLNLKKEEKKDKYEGVIEADFATKSSTNENNLSNIKQEDEMPSAKIYNRDVFILVDQSATMDDKDQGSDKTRWELLGEMLQGDVRKLLMEKNKRRICEEITLYLFSRKKVGLKFKVTPSNNNIKRNIFDENLPDSNTFICLTFKECVDTWFKEREKETKEKEKKAFILIYTDGMLDDRPQFEKLITETCRKLDNQDEIKIVMIGIGDEVRNNPEPFLDLDFNLQKHNKDRHGNPCDIFVFDLADEMDGIIELLSRQFEGDSADSDKVPEWVKENHEDWYQRYQKEMGLE
ncbi:MAG: hypothetical protein F6K58_20460 [Symploca sp. SIO2E9]|nr:hypothetical protein [Symploca sp. SIO2E9]